MTTFHEAYPVSDLGGADYNPRRIDAAEFEELKASISILGLVKPVIVNGNGTLVAGHQRVRVATELGLEFVPAIELDSTISLNDEVRFNLIHNRVDTNVSVVRVNPGERGWGWRTYDEVQIESPGSALFLKHLGDLLERHGCWGSALVTPDGLVVAGAEYAAVCALQRKPLLVFCLEAAEVETAIGFLSGNYGVYDWSHLNVDLFSQFLIQPTRLRARKGSAAGSRCWDKLVMPGLTPERRVLDFGAGKADYVTMLRRSGFDAWGYEPFMAMPGPKLDIRGVVASINALEEDVRLNGLFDVVVCDNVICGCSTEIWQRRVLASCVALLKPDGELAIATRSLELEIERENVDRAAWQRYGIRFLDETNTELRFQHGLWYSMRYMTKEQFVEALSEFFGEVEYRALNGSHGAICRKPLPLDPEVVLEALNAEFNMEYPGGYHHDRHEPLVATIVAQLAQA